MKQKRQILFMNPSLSFVCSFPDYATIIDK